MARGTRGDILHQEVLQREIKRSACACSFLMCNSRRNGATLLVCVVVLCCFRSCAAERQEARFGRQMAAQNTDDPGIGYTEEQLKDNLEAFLTDVKKAKPPSAKGIYISKVTLSSTMRKGFEIDTAKLNF